MRSHTAHHTQLLRCGINPLPMLGARDRQHGSVDGGIVDRTKLQDPNRALAGFCPSFATDDWALEIRVAAHAEDRQPERPRSRDAANVKTALSPLRRRYL